MKLNYEILIELANGQSTKEGIMFYKANDSAYKQRWFKLCSNLLFLYNTDQNPSNNYQSMLPTFMFFMENFVINLNASTPNKFSIHFTAEPDIKYHFFCLNSRQTNEWLECFHHLSYRKQRVHLNHLRQKLKTITGIDPLESTPWSDKL